MLPEAREEGSELLARLNRFAYEYVSIRCCRELTPFRLLVFSCKASNLAKSLLLDSTCVQLFALIMVIREDA